MSKRLFTLLAAVALATLSLAARAAEKVELRAGEHEGYGRIAIQWPTPVAYQAKLEGKTLVIHFARPFTGQINIINRNLDHYIANAAQSADGKTITAKLLRPVELKSELVDHNIIAIDLVQRIETLAAKPDAEMLAKGKVIKAPPPKTATAHAAPAKAEPRQIASLEAPPQAAPLAAVPPAGLDNPGPNPAGEAVVAKIEPAEAKPAAPMPPAATQGDNTAALGTLTPQLVVESGQSSLRFDWPTPIAAAVYRRRSALWLVFAGATKFDLAPLRAKGQGVLSAIDQVPAGSGSALRLVLADGLNPSVRRAGNSWIVDLKRVAAAADAPITVDPRPSATVPAVELHVHQASAPLSIKDPLFGDTLVVVPVGELGRGIDATHSFVDFRLLQTVQGIVIRPNTDDLVVHSDSDAVDITRPHGLALSDEHDRLLGGGVPTDLHRVFDFAAWRGSDNQTFIERRRKLERTAADAAPAARTMPRLDLARFYFAHLFAPETLGVLAQIERDDPASATDRGVQALKGAACFLADEQDCANKLLNLSAFDKEPDFGVLRL